MRPLPPFPPEQVAAARSFTSARLAAARVEEPDPVALAALVICLDDYFRPRRRHDDLADLADLLIANGVAAGPQSVPPTVLRVLTVERIGSITGRFLDGLDARAYAA